MSGFALALVLSAAGLHALWNALIKAAADRSVVLAAVSSVHVVAGLGLVLSSPAPTMESWAFIVASTLIHYVYYVFLFQSYRFGDFSQVYPISRGSAPVLVALGAYLAIGETLSVTAWLGLAGISAGIAILAFTRGANKANPKALIAAMITGLLIASYSVVDGIGVRLADSPFGYMGWLFLLELPVVLFLLHRRRGGVRRLDNKAFYIGLIGGGCAVTAYGLVIFAKTIAPLGAVSAVRESSVIMASLIGVVVFHERPLHMRLLSALAVAAGILTLAYSA
jgi:drug/metabolite transporter (DMT)-like permease